MKRVVFVIFLAVLAGLFFGSCDSPTNSPSNPVEPDEPDEPDEPVGPEEPLGPEEPVDPGKVVAGAFPENLWGEWIRIDNGDSWYISGKKISITGSVSAVPSGPTLEKQSDQVVRVSETGRDPYYLFASRTANASLRGKVVLVDDASSVARARAGGGGMGAIPPIIHIKNPKQPEKPPVETTPDPVTGDIRTAEEFIPGDELEVIIPELPPITVQPLPVPPDNPDYEPPVVPIPIVTEGVNLKASIRPRYAEDSTRLYADGTSMEFLLEIENVGTEDCTAATYEVVYTGSDLVINDPAPNHRLGTLTPKEQGGTAYKKSIPLTITGKPLSGTLAFTDIEIGVKINDTIVKKTWNDSVSIRYNKAKIPFRIRSEYPVQGIIKVPGGKTHHFKTSDSSYGNCSYTIDLPWSTENYFVIFSGATATTESAYSMGINTAPSQAFSAFDDLGIYEPNNDEASAVLIKNSDSIMAYLHGGSRADIDYYRINLGNEVPVIKLVPLEAYAFTDSNGNTDGTINPGESAYLDLRVKNETEQSRTITVNLSVTGSNAGYVTLDKGSATIDGISPQYYASLTNYPDSSEDNVEFFVNYRLSSALKFTISEICPEDISIPLVLSFSDTQGMTWTETVSFKVVKGNRSMVIENPAADCVLAEYSNSNGNGDEDVNPGESFYYKIKVKNTGTDAISGLQGVLATAVSNVTFNTSSVSLGALEPGSSGTAEFRFTVGSSCPPETAIPFTLTLTSSTGTIWALTIPDLTVKARIPQNVQAAADSTDSVKLTWSAVSHTVAGYRVYYAASATGDYALAGSTTGAANFTHTGRSVGTNYYYKVSAYGDGWESGRSDAVFAKTWMDLVFNKAVSGTVAENIPDYYRFHVTNGKSYAFTSDTSAEFMYPNGSSWFKLDESGSQTKTANTTGWALVKLQNNGAYTITITSGEAAVNTFVFSSTSPPSTGTIKEEDKTIFALVPSGTNLTSLTPVVTSASGWTCATTGPKDFSGPVEYRFTKNSIGQAQVYTVTLKTLQDLVFNKEQSGTAKEGMPEYYRFHVTSGKNYTITSNTSAEVMKNDGSFWFNMDDDDSPNSQSANFTGWALIKFTEGAYAFKITSDEGAVTSFGFNNTTPPSTGTVNEAAKTISALVPYNTNLASLAPDITLAAGWTCATTGAQNFSAPVEYRFSNSAGQAQAYTVTVKAWNELVFNKTLSWTAAAGAPAYYGFHVSSGVNYAFVSTKSAEVAKHDGSSWFNLNAGSQSQSAAEDGWALITFTDGAYALTVTSAEAAVSSFGFSSTTPASVGIVNESAKSISVLVPYNTNLASLTPDITPAAGWTCATTGAKNFSGPVEYRFAKDGEIQAYTVTVTRRGQGGITITPPDGDISVAGFPTAAFTVSRSGGAQTSTIQISDTSYSSYEWYVDDTAKTADTGSDGRAFTIRAADYPIGAHTVTIIVYKNGVPYSNEQRFTVAN